MGNENSSDKQRQQRQQHQRQQHEQQDDRDRQQIVQYSDKNLPESGKPYRHIKGDFTNEFCDMLVQEIEAVKIGNEIEEFKDRKWNLIIVGPVGAGKSSFINSVISISEDEYANRAFVGGNIFGSVTNKLKSHSVESKMDNLKFWDTAGLSEEKNSKNGIKIIKKIFDGRVKDGFQFQSKLEKDDWYYNHDRTTADKTHCVIYVVDITMLETVEEPFQEPILDLQRKQVGFGLQRILLLTKCDVLCKLVKQDCANIYKSTEVLQKIKRASQAFGIPEANIHPVVNYGQEGTLNAKMNVPILLALKQCVNFCKDFIKNEKDGNDKRS